MPLGKPIVRVGAWQRIPKRFINESQVKGELTFFNVAAAIKRHVYQSENQEVEKYIKCFLEDENDPKAIYVPRAYEPKYRKEIKKKNIPVHFRRVIWPEDKIVLRKNQKDAYAELVKEPDETLGRFLVLSAGSGKTIVALKAAMKREVPVGVIVDSNELLKQWIERITKYCRISIKDIGRVGGGKFNYKKKK